MKQLMHIAGGVVVLMSYSHIALAFDPPAVRVDEPATMALLAMAAGGIVVARYLRNRKK